MKPRVVFVPGILGSVLVDDDLSTDLAAARAICDQHLGALVRKLAYHLVNDPCDHDPSVTWGEFGMAHWFFNTDEWMRRMLSGNGIDQPWSIEGRSKLGLRVPDAVEARNWGLLRLAIETVELRSNKDAVPLTPVEFERTQKAFFDPYTEFLQAIKGKADLLVFPYDWRLSNAYNAAVLAERIRRKWWKELPTDAIARVTIPEEEKVTIIAHSMGGLIARFYIETDHADVPYIRDRRTRRTPLSGDRFVKRLITVGTPHLGVPEAYLAAIGELDLEVGIKSYWQLKYLRALTFDAIRTVGGRPIQRGQLKTLTASVSSLIEMFPTYRFMPTELTDKDGAPLLLNLDRDARPTYMYFNDWITTNGLGKRPDRELMLLLSSEQTRLPCEIFASFRKRLVPPDCLDVWLKSRGVQYVAAGSMVHQTVTGYNEKSNKVERKSSWGDGVVPWKSWSIYPWSDRDTSHLHWVPVRGAQLHNELFQNGEIHDLCADLVFNPKLFFRRFPNHQEQPVFGVTDVQGLVAAILDKLGFKTVARRRRIVISVITVRFTDTGPDGIMPVEPVGASQDAVKRYVPHTLSAEQRKTLVWSIENKALGARRFIGIKSRTVTFDNLTCGGVIFLPEARCQDFLEILTWNLGDQGTIDNVSTNKTHAEFQFSDCLDDWRRHFGWGDRIASIKVTNAGRSGYSPCSQCLEDVRAAGRSLGGNSRRRIGELVWRTAYTGLAGPTERSDLAKTEATGWYIDLPSRRVIKRP